MRLLKPPLRSFIFGFIFGLRASKQGPKGGGEPHLIQLHKRKGPRKENFVIHGARVKGGGLGEKQEFYTCPAQRGSTMLEVLPVSG